MGLWKGMSRDSFPRLTGIGHALVTSSPVIVWASIVLSGWAAQQHAQARLFPS